MDACPGLLLGYRNFLPEWSFALENLAKICGTGVRALRYITLAIANRRVGVRGPNGAGKSSLMRTSATLQEPDSGCIGRLRGGEHLRLRPSPGRKPGRARQSPARAKSKANSARNTLRFVVKEKPAKGGVGPYQKLIDRFCYDNVKPLEAQKAGSKPVAVK
jgi:ABC-type glutathione transport system ATPase component